MKTFSTYRFIFHVNWQKLFKTHFHIEGFARLVFKQRYKVTEKRPIVVDSIYGFHAPFWHAGGGER